MRRTRLERKTPLRSSGRPIKPKKRSPKEAARIYGDDAHQDWLRALPCVACRRLPTDDRPHHLHHTASGGMGRKADARWQVPLCFICHGHVHNVGPSAFGVDALRQCAIRLAALWQERRGLEPIGRVVARVLPTLTGEDA